MCYSKTTKKLVVFFHKSLKIDFESKEFEYFRTISNILEENRTEKKKREDSKCTFVQMEFTNRFLCC